MYWALLSAALWYLLAGGTGWGVGLVVVLAATATAAFTHAVPPYLNLRHLPGFLFFFLVELWSAGIDVARQSVRPKLSLRPGWVRFRLQAPDSRASLILSAMVGLLPGTLASRIRGGELHIHALNLDQSWRPTVERLETKLTELLEKPSQ